MSSWWKSGPEAIRELRGALRRRGVFGWSLGALIALGALAVPARAGHVAPPAAGTALFETPQLVLPAGGLNLGPVRDRKAAAAAATPTDYGDCGPDARREPGVQGQVPFAAQESGASKDGYRCNLRLVGSNDIGARGANFQLGWHRDCAYVGTVGTRGYASRGAASDGLAVIDASDPRRPRLVRIIEHAVGRSHHEAVEVNERRGMLVVQVGGLAARYVEIYDVSGDCRDPVFKGRYDAGAPIFHGQRISDDGNTVYASDFTGGAIGNVMHVIDVSDMTRPRLLARWDPLQESRPQQFAIHDLDVSTDGRRAYLGTVPPSATMGALVGGPPSQVNGTPSMIVLDTTHIAERRRDPDLRIIGGIRLANWGHTIQRATIGGRPLVFSSGETPFGQPANCPWSWGHVVDVTRDSAPRELGQIKLGVNDVDNCPQVRGDGATYSIHYTGVDDENATTRIFYTYYAGGLRVFDVRDPARPAEIAYYHPPPMPSTLLKPAGGKFGGDAQTPEYDSATSNIRYRPETGQIWMASIGRGFQILELTNEPKVSGAAAVLRERAAGVVRRGRIGLRTRCSRACSLTVNVISGRRRIGRQVVRFPAAGARVVRVKLSRTGRALLRRHPRYRVYLIGVVRDSLGRVTRHFRVRPVRLRS